MGPVGADLQIDVAREDAFDFVADLANRPSFLGHFVSEFRLFAVRSTGVGAGARFRVDTPASPTWMDTVIEEERRPTRIYERGRGGRSNRTVTHTVWEFLEGPGALTTVRVTFWTEPQRSSDRLRELLMVSSPWYARRWRGALRRLRAVLEGDQPAKRVRVAGRSLSAAEPPPPSRSAV